MPGPARRYRYLKHLRSTTRTRYYASYVCTAPRSPGILEASEKYYSYEVLCVVRMYSSSESLTYPGMTSLYTLGNCRSNGTNLKCLIVSELAALWKSTYSTRYLIQCCKVCAWFVTCWVSPILCPIMSFTCFVSYYEFHLCCVLLWV